MNISKFLGIFGVLVLVGGGCVASIEPIEPEGSDDAVLEVQEEMIEGEDSVETQGEEGMEVEEGAEQEEASEDVTSVPTTVEDSVTEDAVSAPKKETGTSGGIDVTDYEAEISDPFSP